MLLDHASVLLLRSNLGVSNGDWGSGLRAQIFRLSIWGEGLTWSSPQVGRKSSSHRHWRGVNIHPCIQRAYGWVVVLHRFRETNGQRHREREGENERERETA